MGGRNRVRRGGIKSSNERECAEKQCKWEEYLEGAENDYGDKASARGHDLREEVKINKRNGVQWHHDLFDQYYSTVGRKLRPLTCTKLLLTLDTIVSMVSS